MEQKNTYSKSRRGFLKYMLGGGLIGFLLSTAYPVIKYLIPPKSSEPAPNSVIAGKVGELKPNSGKIFRFGNQPGILIDTPQGELRAFSAVCTHLGCTVQYRKDLQKIWCACHNGLYNLKGINIAGPPPRPLTPYNVNIKERQVYITKET